MNSNLLPYPGEYGPNGLRGNMKMDTTVINIVDNKSEVKFEIWVHWGLLEAALASEATNMAF